MNDSALKKIKKLKEKLIMEKKCIACNITEIKKIEKLIFNMLQDKNLTFDSEKTNLLFDGIYELRILHIKDDDTRYLSLDKELIKLLLIDLKKEIKDSDNELKFNELIIFYFKLMEKEE